MKLMVPSIQKGTRRTKVNAVALCGIICHNYGIISEDCRKTAPLIVSAWRSLLLMDLPEVGEEICALTGPEGLTAFVEPGAVKAAYWLSTKGVRF